MPKAKRSAPIIVCLFAMLSLSACKTTNRPPPLTLEENILNEIEQNRNFVPQQPLANTSKITPPKEYTADLSNEERIAFVENAFNTVRKRTNQLNEKCLNTKLNTYDNTQGIIIVKYEKAMEAFKKCAKKNNAIVTYSTKPFKTEISFLKDK